jgi:hypothetical protein
MISHLSSITTYLHTYLEEVLKAFIVGFFQYHLPTPLPPYPSPPLPISPDPLRTLDPNINKHLLSSSLLFPSLPFSPENKK